ncbi:hypothetical protein [Thalassotalea sp. PLHSN55]|uniref:hypothetical protein n=1 Tax=Thalassotalea sp. PLHSN55 TaxID=3435888 RepID=UPI003F849BB7
MNKNTIKNVAVNMPHKRGQSFVQKRQIQIRQMKNWPLQRLKCSMARALYLSSFCATSAIAANTTLFQDDFESGSLANAWSNTGSGSLVVHAGAASGGSDYGVKVRKGATMALTLDSSNADNLVISYDRSTNNLSNDEKLQVQWSFDGSNWQLFETTQSSSWASKSFIIATDNQPEFNLRFNVTSSRNGEQARIDNVNIIGQSVDAVINPNVVTEPWSFLGNGEASHVAAAQVSGSYAVVDSATQAIEIRDIRQNLQHFIDFSAIESALPNADLTGGNGICSVAFTPSGRHLFIGVCTGDSGSEKDAILAFNTNTKALTEFDRLTIRQNAGAGENFPMLHFKGELYVGTDNGLYRYDASKNAVADNVADQPIDTIVPADNAQITGLAVDMVKQVLYVSTDSSLYQADATATLALSAIASDVNIKSIAYARTYGGSNTGGLYLLKEDLSLNTLMFIPTSSLHASGTQTLVHYTDFEEDISAISASADGKILLAANTPKMMSDSTDHRKDFDAWLLDELAQYVASIKSLVGSGIITGTNSLVPEGFLTRKIVAPSQNLNDTPIADNVGWALFLLMAADQVSPDADIESIIELLIQRHSGLHPDGLGGVKTVDGHFMRNYISEGIPNANNPQPQVYISMKFIPAVYKAAELYPNNANIQAYKDYLRQTFKRGSDTIRANQRITWENDDHGPIGINNKMTNETWIYGDLAAAQDPLATQDYARYVYSRQNMNYNEWLTGEPVILPSHSAFIIMGGSMILRHHFDDPDWQEQNTNYYGVTMAASDDLGAPYFAAFSAGNNPYASGSSYYNDGPSDHPGDMIHFPAVLGLGQLGWTEPMVGGYQAYRDGLRQEMLNGSGGVNFAMLTRWTRNDPSYEMPSVGIADYWYGAMGLMETIQPGIMDVLRDEFYLPQWHQHTNSNGNVELEFSKLTPRRIIGIDSLGNKTSYGFQLSPFEFEQGQSYQNYQVIDPEGELIELDPVFANEHAFKNPDFEDGYTGWTKTGDYKFYLPQINGISIVGKSAEIRTNPNVQDSQGSVSQTLDLSGDLVNTRYKFRANGFIASTGAPGKGYLQIQWDNDNSLSNGVISTAVSNHLDANNPRVEFLIDGQKPANANFVHIAFVVETVTPLYHRYIFDDLSVVRLGADAPIANGDFENGITDWAESASQITLTTDINEVIDGNASLKFSLGAGITGWKKATKNLDVSNDPLGTRYIFRLDTNVISMTDSDFEILIEPYDASGNPVLQHGSSTNALIRNDIGDITQDTQGEISFTFRKRPGDDNYNIVFRMKRNSADSIGTDTVVIDNFRLDKEQLF